MKLYKYRPINQSLFKELLYREIFLAKYSELNDPMDMISNVDFKPRNDQDIRHLVQFVLHNYLIFNMRYLHERIEEKKTQANNGIVKKLINLRKNEEECDWIVDAFYCEFKKYKEVVAIDALCEILENLHIQYPNEFDYLGNTSEFKQKMEFLREMFLNNSTTACFSESNNNFLMWSHYADRHEGICIEFDLRKIDDNACEISIEGQVPKNNDPDILEVVRWNEHVRKVKYVEKPFYTNFYEFLPVFTNYGDVDLHELSKSYWHPYADKLENIFLHKLIHWKYEKEWRIVRVEFKEG